MQLIIKRRRSKSNIPLFAAGQTLLCNIEDRLQYVRISEKDTEGNFLVLTEKNVVPLRHHAYSAQVPYHNYACMDLHSPSSAARVRDLRQRLANDKNIGYFLLLQENRVPLGEKGPFFKWPIFQGES